MRRRIRRFGRAVGILVFGSLVLAGCGGGDTKEASTTAPVDSSTPAADSGGSADDAPAVEGSCASVDLAMRKMAASYSEAMAGQSSAELDQWVESVNALVAAAPNEVRADLKKVAAAYTATAKLWASYNADVEDMTPTEGMARLDAVQEPINTDDFNEASIRVSVWLDGAC